MLSGIDWIHSPINHTYIAAKLTRALVKFKSNDKEYFGDCFSRPRLINTLLAPNQSKIVVGVAAHSKISRQECFHCYAAYSNFSRAKQIRSRQRIPKSPYFIVSVETQDRIRQILLRICKYLDQWKRGFSRYECVPLFRVTFFLKMGELAV